MAVRTWWAGQSFRTRICVVALLGLLWRLFYVHFEQPYRILTDEAWYVTQAQRLFGPHPFTSLFDYSVPTAQHGPLMSVLMAPLAWLFPHANEGLRYFVPFIGFATIVGFAMVGRAIKSERTGVAAAIIAAIMPDLWVRDGLVVAEPLAITIVVWVVYVFIRVLERRTIGWGVTLGCLLGALALTRAESVALSLVVVLLLLWAMRRDRRDALRVGVSIATVGALVLAPWVIFNSHRFEKSVILTNNLGITLAGANCHATYFDGRYLGYDTPICWDAAQNAARKISSDEAVQSAEMTNAGLRYAKDHIGRLPLVMTMRELWLLGVYHPGYVVKMSALGGQPRWATWLQAVSFWCLIVFTSAIAWRQRRSARAIVESPVGQLLALFGAFTFCLSAVFVGHWRYRSTLDVVLILILAVAWGSTIRCSDSQNPSSRY